ncbi:MAG: hypothetical protein IT483_13615, partial [Gammaproteobacteria bacterium]|nr:hypothetical protein [Gammaproteobacteria bacterium]
MSAKNGRRMPGSRPRALNLRPLAKAVRGALSVSASALAISLVASPAAEASYPAFCGYDAPTNTAYCNGYSYWDGSQWVVVDTTYDTLTGTELGVEDLTLVVGNSNWTYLRPDYYEEDGILANWGGDITVNVGNYGVIDTYQGNGIVATTGYGGLDDATVVNDGFIRADQDYSNPVAGISVYAADDATVVNNDGIDVNGVNYSTGVAAYALNGDVVVDNNGWIDVVSTSSTAVGIQADGVYAHVSNDGSLQVDSFNGLALGIDVDGESFDVLNTGSIGVSGGQYAFGIDAHGGDGDSSVTNFGSISVDGANDTYGIRAYVDDGDLVINNRGGIDAYSKYDDAYGIYVVGSGGIVSVANRGDITVDGQDNATGIEVGAYYGTRATIVNSGTIDARAERGDAYGMDIDADQGGNIVVTNAGSGAIDAVSDQGQAFGVYVDHDGSGDVTVRNDGRISATTYSNGSYGGEDAFGIYVEASGGSISITNFGEVRATAVDGAEGFYAASGDAIGIAVNSYDGSDVSVRNAGDVVADSWYSDAAGIDIYVDEGGGSVLVRNDRLVSAHSDTANAYGVRVGQYDGGEAASPSDVTLINAGVIYADSVFGNAYGVSIDAGTVDVSNAGVIAAFATIDEGRAAGVSAIGKYGVEFDNSGRIDVQADGAAGTSFFDASAAGAFLLSVGGDVDATNSGSIYSYSHQGDAVGIGGVSYLGGVSITTEAGSLVDVDAGWFAYGNAIGIGAYTFVDGGITIDSAGDVMVRADDSATGIGAGNLKYGDIEITNSGLVDVLARGEAVGIDVEGSDGTITVVNAAGGVIDVESREADAFGIRASSDGGGIEVANYGSITVDANYDATGISASSYSGNVLVVNGGSIDAATAYGDDAIGIEASSVYGDVSVRTQAGSSIAATNATGDATGIDASADAGGQVYVRNDGSITVEGSPYYNDEVYVTGIRAEAGDYFDGGETGGWTLGSVTVRNYGTIDVSGGYDVWGIDASTDQGDILVVNAASGSITLNSGDDSYGGIVAHSNGGDITAANLGDITVDSAEDAYGIAVNAGQDGNVYVFNSGAIDVAANSTYSYYYYGGDEAIGIEARVGSGDLDVVTTGTITVASASGEAYGVYVDANHGDVTVV